MSASQFNPSDLFFESDEETEECLVPVQVKKPSRVATDLGLFPSAMATVPAIPVASPFPSATPKTIIKNTINNGAKRARSALGAPEPSPSPASKRMTTAASHFKVPTPPKSQEDPITEFEDEDGDDNNDKSDTLGFNNMEAYGINANETLRLLNKFDARLSVISSFWNEMVEQLGAPAAPIVHPISTMPLALVGPQSAGKSATLQLLVSPGAAKHIVSSAGQATTSASIHDLYYAKSIRVIDTQGHRAMGASINYNGMGQVQQIVKSLSEDSADKLTMLGVFRASTPDHIASMEKAREEALAGRAELVFLVTRADSLNADSLADLMNLLQSMKSGGEKVFFLANPPQQPGQGRAVHTNNSFRTAAEYKAHRFVANTPELQEYVDNVGLYALLKYLVEKQARCIEEAHGVVVQHVRDQIEEVKGLLASSKAAIQPSVQQFPSEAVAHVAKGVLCLSNGAVFKWPDFCMPSRFQVQHPSVEAVKSVLMDVPAPAAGQGESREVSCELMEVLLDQVNSLPPQTLRVEPIPPSMLTHMTAKYTHTAILHKATAFSIAALRNAVRSLVERAANACLDVWMSWVRLVVSKKADFVAGQSAAVQAVFEAVLRGSLAKSSAPLTEAVILSLDNYQTPTNFDAVQAQRVFAWIKPSAEAYQADQADHVAPTMAMLQEAYEGHPGDLASAMCFCVLEDAKMFCMRSLAVNLRSSAFQTAFSVAVKQLVDSPDQVESQPIFANFLKQAQAPALKAVKDLTRRLALLQGLMTAH